jgi:3-phosphoshikimate 1-carboxyvinyltransferase
MHLLVQPTAALSGFATPPSSKSQSIRGMILALLSKGESTLLNPLDSDDMQAAMTVCMQLGADVSVYEDKLVIKSAGLPLQANTKRIYTSNSGITTRFILPLLGLRQDTQTPMILDCGDQMRERPIQSLVEALRVLGLSIEYLDQQGKLPVAISGQLLGGQATIDGMTSQYLSALLIALPCAKTDSEITVNHLNERPYVEMTLGWLKTQNIHYHHHQTNNRDVYEIKGNQTYTPFHAVIQGDFSSASYLIAAATMTPGCVELDGLSMDDPQGDKRLVPILQSMGAEIKITPTGLIIHGGRPLTGLCIDANDIPDLLPTLAVVGTYAHGKTTLTNVPQARLKETDRIHSMTQGLTRLGARIEEHPDGMTIYHSQLTGTCVKGYDDHRTVMALAIAGILGQGITSIDTCEAMNKTFPSFISMMKSLGANMEIQHAG